MLEQHEGRVTLAFVSRHHVQWTPLPVHTCNRTAMTRASGIHELRFTAMICRMVLASLTTNITPKRFQVADAEYETPMSSSDIDL